MNIKVALELQPCLKNKSGIGVYTYELAKLLQGFDDIELKGNIFNFINRNDISNDVKELNFHKNICKLFPYGIYRRIWNHLPVNYNSIFNDKSDIYHFFNFIVPPRISGKVITTIHDMTYELYPETMDYNNLKRIKRDIEYSINRADKIITVSENSKKDIVKLLNVDEEKIEVVYNGVEYERFYKAYTKDQELIVRKKYGLPNKYILYMGTLEPRKNIESIITAFSMFISNKNVYSDDIKLVIAGKKGWLYESIFDLVKKLSIEDKVVFTDYVDETDKPLIYNMASIFIFPSIYEGFGIPVLEAMASSVPVITSTSSSLPEVAGDAAMLVEPKDVEAIAKAIEEILEDEVVRKSMIEKGHIQAKKFNWESSAKKLLSIYRDLYNS